MSEEQLQRQNANSVFAGTETLHSLEEFASAVSASDRVCDPDELSAMMRRVTAAVDAHRNSSQNYIALLEEIIRRLRSRRA